MGRGASAFPPRSRALNWKLAIARKPPESGRGSGFEDNLACRRSVPDYLQTTITTRGPRLDGRLLFRSPKMPRFNCTLLDLELSQDGVPTDVDFVPLGFQAAQGAFTHVPEETE